MLTVLAALGITFALSLVMTPVVRAVARKTGFVAKPRADRWHSKPTALMGGVGIYLSFIVCFYSLFLVSISDICDRNCSPYYFL